MANIFKILLRHVKEYCQAAAIHGPRHIVSPQLAVVERLVYDLFFRDIIIVLFFENVRVLLVRGNTKVGTTNSLTFFLVN